MYDFLSEIKQIKDILDNELIYRGITNVNVIYDLEEQFDLSDINNNSTPVIIIEASDIVSTNAGAKGQMTNGQFIFTLTIIVEKLNRKFDDYYGELNTLVENIRNIFEMTPNKSYQFDSSKFINNYDISGYQAVAVISTYIARINNYDYS